MRGKDEGEGEEREGEKDRREEREDGYEASKLNYHSPSIHATPPIQVTPPSFVPINQPPHEVNPESIAITRENADRRGDEETHKDWVTKTSEEWLVRNEV